MPDGFKIWNSPNNYGCCSGEFIPLQKDMLHNLILPIFAFANSGVRIENFSLEILTTPLVLEITFGLFFGKRIGVL